MAVPWLENVVASAQALTGASPLAITIGVTVLAVAAGALLGWLAEALITRVLVAGAKRSTNKLDDLLVHALRGPAIFLGALWGAAVGLIASPTSEATQSLARGSILLVGGVALVVVAARLLGGAIVNYGERARLVGPARHVARRVTIAAVYVVGALIILDGLGVSITPLLTTLGLAGLAIALALQDTISNFFAGIYVQADRPMDVGHYVRIEDGAIEGFVVEVGWRTTKIRTLGNNLVVIPNAKVAASIVTDYDLPEPRMSLLVRVPVARDADPKLVERVLVEEATKAAGSVPGLLASPEPFVRFIPGFTEYGLEFTLICQVQTFVDQYAVQHDLRRRIIQRLAQEGVTISVPYRAVVTEVSTREAAETSRAVARE